MQGTYGTARMTSRASEHYPHCGWDCCPPYAEKRSFRRTARRTEKQRWQDEIRSEIRK